MSNEEKSTRRSGRTRKSRFTSLSEKSLVNNVDDSVFDARDAKRKKKNTTKNKRKRKKKGSDNDDYVVKKSPKKVQKSSKNSKLKKKKNVVKKAKNGAKIIDSDYESDDEQEGELDLPSYSLQKMPKIVKELTKDIIDKIEGMKATEMKQLLEDNGQTKSGNKRELSLKILDMIKYGTLPECGHCQNARVKIKNGKYRCPGYYDDEDYCRCNKAEISVVRVPFEM